MRSQFRKAKLATVSVVAAIILGGCVTTWDYPKGPVVSKSKDYSITLPKDWTYILNADGSGLISTFDGPSLQSLAVREHPLKKKLPYSEAMLKSEMTAEQMVDAMFENVLKNSRLSGATLERAGPAKLDGRDGFQLIYTYTVGSGLRYRENMIGVIKDGTLIMVSFTAPTRHYYDQYDDVLPGVLAAFKFE